MKRRVLFVCTANSARSLMAEALLRNLAGDRFEVASAGTGPTRPHPMALQVLEESGIAAGDLHSKGLADLQGQNWDYVITLCEKAAKECVPVCQPAQQIAWDFPDPVPGNQHATFVLTLKALRERIALFARVHEKTVGSPPVRYDPAVVFKALGDELRLAMLLLIREQKKLCVYELTQALAVSQPKVSRHLSGLRGAGLLDTERHGQWVYYQLNPLMPDWVKQVLDNTAAGNPEITQAQTERLNGMPDRPTARFN